MKKSPEPDSSSIDQQNLKKASGLFRAADHLLRQKMLLLIHQNLRMDVKSIYKTLKMEQSVTSHHLGILRDAKMVTTERNGKHIFYNINYEKIKELHRTAGKMIEE